MESLARRTSVCCAYAAVITCLACGGDTPQTTTPVAVVPAPSPVGPLYLRQLGWFEGRMAWAGTTLVAPPQLRVVRIDGHDDVGVAGVPVRFTVRSAAGAGRDTVVMTDATGIAGYGSWTLSAVPGVNSVTATVDSVGSLSFSVLTRAKPNVVATYQLRSNSSVNAVPSALLVFGDDGSFEAAFDQDLRGSDGYPDSRPYRAWNLFSYSMSGSTFVLGPEYASWVSSGPDDGVIAVARGDSLILSYSDADFDPPLAVRQIYVLSKSPPLASAMAGRRAKPNGMRAP